MRQMKPRVIKGAACSHIAGLRPSWDLRGGNRPPWCLGASLRSGFPLGFHLNNQLTQALTSRYRDSRLRVDFERFVSCVAQLTCIFREGHPGMGGAEGGCLPWQGDWGGRCLSLLLFSAQATAASTWMGVRGSYA